MVLKKAILLLLLLASTASIVCSGCAGNRPIVLHPIDKQDIFQLPTGTIVKIPIGSVWYEDNKAIKTWDMEENFVIDRQSYSLSQYYLMEVVRARTEK